MQVKIKTITDLSLALQVAEQRNNVIVRNRFNSIRKDVYQAKKNREVASNYYKSMNNISSQSYFMDKKNENIIYRWKAYNQFDLIQNLEQRGHIVDEITGEMANYESDEPFALSLREQFDRAEYDLVMTVNFFLLYPMNVKKEEYDMWHGAATALFQLCIMMRFLINPT